MSDALKAELEKLIEKKEAEIPETIGATRKVLEILEEGFDSDNLNAAIYDEVVLQPVRRDIITLHNHRARVRAIKDQWKIYQELHLLDKPDLRWIKAVMSILRSLGTTGTSHT